MGRKPCKHCAGAGNVSIFQKSQRKVYGTLKEVVMRSLSVCSTESLLGVQWEWLSLWKRSMPPLQWQRQGKVRKIIDYNEYHKGKNCYKTYWCYFTLFCYSCNFCHGQGAIRCEECKGKQQLLVYINLTVKWYSIIIVNHIYAHRLIVQTRSHF